MGARDRIAAGESTFQVELTETAAVLRHATVRGVPLRARPSNSSAFF